MPNRFEEILFIPERNQLIVDSYLRHVRGKPGVTFCVNIAHAEMMTKLYNEADVPAATVSGRMPGAKRDSIFADFATGDIMMLCACDLLNEGWDAPHTEVLMMARPTLSRVLYVQQLGRGTETISGKRLPVCLRFCGQCDALLTRINNYRLFCKKEYRPGELVAAPPDQIAAESDSLNNGGLP